METLIAWIYVALATIFTAVYGDPFDYEIISGALKHGKSGDLYRVRSLINHEEYSCRIEESSRSGTTREAAIYHKMNGQGACHSYRYFFRIQVTYLAAYVVSLFNSWVC
jgi:hypothetical protein